MKNTILNILFVLLVGAVTVFVYITVKDAADSRYSVSHFIDAVNADAELAAYANGHGPDMLPVTAVYTVDTETASITGIQIEVLNCNYPSSLTYIDLPADSRFTMSEELYRRLCASLVEMPQVVTLSECLHYYGIGEISPLSCAVSEDMVKPGTNTGGDSSAKTGDAVAEADQQAAQTGNALEAATLMLSELAGTKIGYYSLISSGSNECLLTNMTSETRSIYRESRESALPYATRSDAAGERTNSAFLIDKNSLTLKVYNAMYK